MNEGIRRPVNTDADGMGRVHVRAWQAAYQAIMPHDYLADLKAEDRASMWRRQIDAMGGEGLLVSISGGEVVGIAAFGPCEDKDASAEEGQLYAINFDPDHWGKGLGRALLRAATDELAHRGFTSSVLWVVPDNARARTLYESEGWTPAGTSRDEEVLGATVAELRYRRT